MEISPGPFCCWLSCITYGLLDRLGRTHFVWYNYPGIWPIRSVTGPTLVTVRACIAREQIV